MKKFLKRCVIIYLALILAVTNGGTAIAQEPTNMFDYFNLQDIRLYDPNDSDPCIGQELVGNDNLERIFNFLVAKGLSPVQAAAITGNINIESVQATDPLIVERHPTADLPQSTDDPASLPTISGWPGGQTRQPGWGLIQWTPATKFVTIARELDIPKPHNLNAQLEVIWYHMTDVTPTGRENYLTSFSQIDDIETATEDFMTKFLAPLASVSHYEERLAAAESALSQYGRNNPSVVQNSSGCYDEYASPSDPTGIVATALRYAWPTQAYTLQLKPEYREAITTAKANGENVNGSGRGGPARLDGIDCHIYVKRVMRDSGADPEYSTDFSIQMGMDYMSSSPKYEEYRPTSEADLTPGTIIGYMVPGTAPGQPGRHILLYVGENDYLEDGRNKVAEASLPTYSPQAGWTDPMGGQFKNFHRYFRVVDGVGGAM